MWLRHVDSSLLSTSTIVTCICILMSILLTPSMGVDAYLLISQVYTTDWHCYLCKEQVIQCRRFNENLHLQQILKFFTPMNANNMRLLILKHVRAEIIKNCRMLRSCGHHQEEYCCREQNSLGWWCDYDVISV